MKEEDLDYFDYNLNEDNSDEFSIKSKLEFTSEYLEIGGMFSSKSELEEAGITKSNRIVTAYTPNGYNMLRDMGFSHKEILKQYAKGESH